VKALVTGAGGFVGGAIAAALRERGDQVRAFSRHEHAGLAARGIEAMRGDVADAAAVAAAVEGMDVVFHAAAKVSAAGAWAEFSAANVDGTRNVIAACRTHGVGALVFTSTPSVACGHEDLEGVDESIGYASHFDAHYARSKAIAEREVLAADGPELWTVALRPHVVWGPGDTSLMPRVLARARAGHLRRLDGPPKRVDPLFVDDAVRAHVLAGDALRAAGDVATRIRGRAYFLGSGTPVEIWTFVDRLLAAAGLPPVRRRIGRRTALAAGLVLERAHAWLGRSGEPRLSRWIVRELSTSRWFDIGAAERDLGWRPQVGLDEGMDRLARWFAEGAKA
jgi:nucleoside-diphosphate-sugar epimerase